jgi:prepilin-type N-terminal cleavage/methylation domain-containing protein
MLSKLKNKSSGPARTFTRIFSKGGCFKGGFTLLEILLVIGIIAILAGIVIVAINPSKQLATVRNTERKSDLKQIANAITQFYIDHSYYPASTTFSTTSLMTICPTGASTSPAAGFNCEANNLLNLSELVPTYITAIPNDPGTTTTAGYSVMLVNKNPAVSAPLAELGVTISVGNVPVAPTGCSATGGTISTTTGYRIHTFTSSGTFTVTGNCNVEVLVVAGGGGGSSGGGGAGGLIYNASYSVSESTTITVGAGGAGGTDISAGGSGSNSMFGSLVAIGGGVGGLVDNYGVAGGSGGGGGRSGANTDLGGSGTSGQGNTGGRNFPTWSSPYPSGGGGGAGAVGGNATSASIAGNGGIGLAYAISGTSVYYAGGGGGSTFNAGTYGTGGLGGGGNGASNGNGSPGSPNTGGGGGGGGSGRTPGISNGGSGVVIVRYAI